jgi:hypothetical protein
MRPAPCQSDFGESFIIPVMRTRLLTRGERASRRGPKAGWAGLFRPLRLNYGKTMSFTEKGILITDFDVATHMRSC